MHSWFLQFVANIIFLRRTSLNRWRKMRLTTGIDSTSLWKKKSWYIQLLAIAMLFWGQLFTEVASFFRFLISFQKQNDRSGVIIFFEKGIANDFCYWTEFQWVTELKIYMLIYKHYRKWMELLCFAVSFCWNKKDKKPNIGFSCLYSGFRIPSSFKVFIYDMCCFVMFITAALRAHFCFYYIFL